MIVDGTTHWIVWAHDEIVRISRRRQIELIAKKKQYLIDLPTIDNIEFWANEGCDWSTAPIEKSRFIHLVGIYHSVYINELKKV